MLQYSPKIVTDSLVMCLDASNNKSYPATDLPVKAGLLLWLDAADDTTFSYSSGTEVSQWRDKSGNNFHANQATTAQQPSRSTVVNSRKSVNFSSANGDRLRVNSGMVFTNSVTAIVFIKPGTQNNAYANVLDQDHGMDGANGWVIQRNNVSSAWLSWVANAAGDSWFNPNQISYTDNTSQIVTLRKGSSTITLYSNGTSSGDVAVADQQIRQANYFGLNIGTWRAGNELYASSRHYNGEICEIVVYNRALSLTELKQVHTYLGQKWGISNTDRQIFDLSGNNFNFAFNGTNPRYNAKSIVSNFNTTSPYAVSSFGGQNLTSAILNLLYVDHTIEVAVNLKGFKAVKSFDNARDYEGAAGIILWQGYHSGLYVDAATQKLTYLIWNATPDYVAIEYVLPNDLKDKILYITAKRQANVLSLFINGNLVAGPTSITTTVRSYTQINIGAAYQGDPSSGGSLGAFVWAGQHEYHLIRMYNKALNTSELVSNYQAFKARFDNNIVRFGLVLDLDAGNPYSYAGAGTTWYDVSGAGNDFTIQGNVTWDAINGFSNFDGNSTGSGNKIYRNSFPQNLKTSQGGNGYTIIVVARSTINGSWRKLIGNGDGDNYIDLYQNPSGYWAQECGSTLYVDGVQVNNGTFFMSNSGFHCYAATNSNTGTLTNPVYALTIGNEPNSSPTGTNAYPWIGNIAIVLMYNRVLTTTELLQNYNALKGRFGL